MQVSIYNGKNMSSMYNFTGEQVCTFMWYSRWQEGYIGVVDCVKFCIVLGEKLIKFVGIQRI